MKSKNLLWGWVYIFSFTLLCYGPTGCKPAQNTSKTRSPQTQACIDAVIRLDNELGKTRNHACETISLSETIRNYAGALGKMSFESCPKDFKNAFMRHQKAWLDITVVTDKYPDLRGEMHVLFKQLESGKDAEAFKPLQKAVWDTWAEVEKAMK